MSKNRPSPIVFRLRWTLNNLRMRPGRTLLTVLGIALAVSLLVSVSGFHRGYHRALERSIEQLGFEVLVTAKGCPYEAATLFLRGGNIPMYIDAATQEAVKGDVAVKSSTGLLLQTVVDDGRQQVFLGVDERFLEMKPWLELQMGNWFEATEHGVAVLGYNAASELRKVPGDTLEIAGRPGSVRVVGILSRCGAQDDGTIFLPLSTAQKIFDRKDSLTGIGVRLRSLEKLPDFLRRMYSLPGVQAVPMSQAQGTILNFVGSARKLLMAVGILTAVVAALALANSVLMSQLERRRELAILRALGARSAFLFASVLLEASLLGLLGGLAGIFLAIGGGTFVERFLRYLIPFNPRGSLLEIDGSTIALSLLLTLAAGIACCLYPAWRAATVRPLRALRQE